MHPCSFSNGGHYKFHIDMDIDIDKKSSMQLSEVNSL